MHLLIWIAYLSLLSWMFSNFHPWDVAITRAAYMVFFQAVVFYVNAHYLIPKFFDKKKYYYYSMGVLALMLAFSASSSLRELIPYFETLNEGLPPKIARRFHRGFKGPIHLHGRGGGEVFRFLMGALPIIPILFFSTVYRNVHSARQREEEERDLKHRNLEAEMQFLRSQINPHFLFNALNNIYSLTQIRPNEASPMILKLSEMLRYVLYESSVEKVTLTKEIGYLENFIDLQKLKDSEMENITFEHQKADVSLQIAPMILIPFVENSFKHSGIQNTSSGWIKMELTTEGDKMHFTCTNSVPKVREAKDEVGGVGLKNVRRRLELVYPEKHDLRIEYGSEEFKVSLIIDLS